MNSRNLVLNCELLSNYVINGIFRMGTRFQILIGSRVFFFLPRCIAVVMMSPGHHHHVNTAREDDGILGVMNGRGFVVVSTLTIWSLAQE